MLICYGHSVRLPQSDLAYMAFRLAIQETLSDIELHLDSEEEPDPPVGYLTEVPFLEQVPRLSRWTCWPMPGLGIVDPN